MKEAVNRESLKVAGLSVSYDGRPAVEEVSFTVAPGECLGIVGESGSGKSTISLSLMGYLPANADLVRGTVELGGKNLAALSRKARRSVVGNEISMVYQSPMVALNPRLRIGTQVAECMTVHGASRDEAEARSLELLHQVRLPRPEDICRRYPQELSGGQLQRVVIAMAISCRPSVIVMDEPTTGLDVRTEAAVLDLITDLRAELGMSVILISHDLGLVSKHADHVMVMRNGHVVEEGPSSQVLQEPKEDYTKKLLDSLPQVDVPYGGRQSQRRPLAIEQAETVMKARDLTVEFKIRRASGSREKHAALDKINVDLHKGEILGVVGESGSGKTTFSRVLSGLQHPTSGSVDFSAAASRRGKVSLVFQDPTSTLNPVRTVGWTIKRTLKLAGVPRSQRRERMLSLLDDVRLERGYAGRRPVRLSGGERQRVSIARALAQDPEVMILDEPTSALDVSVQSSILELLLRIRDERNIPMVFVTHDLGVVRSIADRIVVFHEGQIVEDQPSESLFEHPEHPYVRALLEASQAVHAIA